jgi:hypothetical protein
VTPQGGITGSCDRKGKARDPKERDHGYQSSNGSNYIQEKWSLYFNIFCSELQLPGGASRPCELS